MYTHYVSYSFKCTRIYTTHNTALHKSNRAKKTNKPKSTEYCHNHTTPDIVPSARVGMHTTPPIVPSARVGIHNTQHYTTRHKTNRAKKTSKLKSTEYCHNHTTPDIVPSARVNIHTTPDIVPSACVGHTQRTTLHYTT